MCLDREFNKPLLEAPDDECAAASERTAAGPSDPREEHKAAVRSADVHPGTPVIVGTRVLSDPIADEPAAAARAGA
jgi:hypothetical protein